MLNQPLQENTAQGLLLGLVLGDALGLPAEGLSARRVRRWYPGRWRQRFLGAWGMGSDDSEQTWFVTQSLLAQGQDAEAFARRLGWCLRGWLLGLPAGIGFATLRAIVKLWLGFSAQHSGVYSAGNGAAMRVAPIGARFAHAAAQRRAFVRASTRLTHTDERAYHGALAVAEVIAWIVREAPPVAPPADWFCDFLRALAAADTEWQGRVDAMALAFEEQRSVAEFAHALSGAHGVSGYVYHSVPVALYAWYVHFGDFAESLQAVLNCGGDTDTVGAITGALAGATGGLSGIPPDWLAGYADYPRSRGKFLQLGSRLARAAQGESVTPLGYFWLALPVRNLLFLMVVLLHGLRRLLPPY